MNAEGAAVLDGRAAIVTGAGRGIGRAIAAELVAAGARVILADNGTSTGGEGADPGVARDAATALGKRALAFSDSVASPGAAKQLVDLAKREFGGLDILVNTAAIRRQGTVFDTDPRDWDAVIRNNLSAPFYLTHAASAVMRAQAGTKRGGADGYDWGRIVNIVSPEGLFGTAAQAAYASAKAGLLGLTHATAMDLTDVQITANAIVPLAGSSGTEILPDMQPVATLVTALCMPAGKAITGQVLGVRGREILLFGSPGAVATFDSTASGATLAEALATAAKHS